jgi:hypothetical protein
MIEEYTSTSRNQFQNSSGAAKEITQFTMISKNRSKRNSGGKLKDHRTHEQEQFTTGITMVQIKCDKKNMSTHGKKTLMKGTQKTLGGSQVGVLEVQSSDREAREKDQEVAEITRLEKESDQQASGNVHQTRKNVQKVPKNTLQAIESDQKVIEEIPLTKDNAKEAIETKQNFLCGIIDDQMINLGTRMLKKATITQDLQSRSGIVVPQAFPRAHLMKEEKNIDLRVPESEIVVQANSLEKYKMAFIYL